MEVTLKIRRYNPEVDAEPHWESYTVSAHATDRILDALPFTSSIRFDMELWHWRHTKMNYAPAVFWYARPGATRNVAPDPESAALPVAKLPTNTPSTYFCTSQ